jgi:hypothetical protein
MEAEAAGCSAPRQSAGGALGTGAETPFLITVRDALSRDVPFQCVRGSTIGGLMDAYAQHTGVERQKVVMIFENMHIMAPDQTTE